MFLLRKSCFLLSKSCYTCFDISSKFSRLVVSEEVKEAVAGGKGVVALESTVITHGLPYPENLRTTELLEKVVRSEGAIPATVAVLNGVVQVGTGAESLRRLATSTTSEKMAKRDLVFAAANRSDGGTTVSATMFAAHCAGIDVFATGGIGGVHRAATQTLDISADLTELSRTPVAVVCAGVKSILDVAKTLEFLETQSVPVVVFGDSDEFPGFFTRKTHLRTGRVANSPSQVAEIINSSHELGLASGILVACHPPEELDSAFLELCISESLQEARNLGIQQGGKALTPFLLNRLREKTGGASLHANISLLENNARIAAKIAVELSELKRRNENFTAPQKSIAIGKDKDSACDAVVVGVSIVDDYVVTDEDISGYRFLDDARYADWLRDEPERTNSGKLWQSCGGVGWNHAIGLTRLGVKTRLVSLVNSSDLCGTLLQQTAQRHANLIGPMKSDEISTARYLAVLERGALKFCVGQIEEAADAITPDLIKKNAEHISRCKILVVDGNLSLEALKTVCEMASFYNVPVWYDPTDAKHWSKIFSADIWRHLSYISPNKSEFLRLLKHLNAENSRVASGNLQSYLREEFSFNGFEHLKTLVVTIGDEGVVIIENVQNAEMRSTHAYSSPVSAEQVLSVSGAGDCFNAGYIAGLLGDLPTNKRHQLALSCAAKSLMSRTTVPDNLSELKLN